MHNMPVINFSNIMNVKDSRWLQLEVCREYQRNKCTRPDTECKFAHPPSTVEVQNGRVTACYDSIKGRCNREKPPCKYFHPPQHLKDQLLINGRNHLALKNAFMTQIQNITPGAAQLVHGTVPVASAPYMTGVATLPNYSPYLGSQPVMTVGVTDPVAQSLNSVVPQHIVQPQKVARTDRIETFPGVGIPFKRPAPEKSGVTAMYQPGNAAYHQALVQQIGGQTYVPVSCEYDGSGAIALPQTAIDLSESPPTNTSVASSNDPLPSSSTITYSNASASPKSTVATSSHKAISSNGASPTLPANILSYAGYPINKAVRQPIKSPLSGAAVAGTYPNVIGTLGSYANMGNVNYGVSPTAPGFALPLNNMMFPSGTGMGTATPGLSMAATGMPSFNTGVPVLSSPLLYSQYSTNPFFMSQLSALSGSAPTNSWAQTSDQPFKKLKTS